jgi:hypothetical protein
VAAAAALVLQQLVKMEASVQHLQFPVQAHIILVAEVHGPQEQVDRVAAVHMELLVPAILVVAVALIILEMVQVLEPEVLEL